MMVKRSDVIGGSLSIILGVLLLTWLIPDWVEPDHDLRLPVSLVPQIVATGFVLCGTALLIKSCFFNRLEQAEAADRMKISEWRGLLVMIAILTVATIGFQFFHFLLVAPVLVAIGMWMYGPVKPLRLLLTSVSGPVAIWFFATYLLGRVVP